MNKLSDKYNTAKKKAEEPKTDKPKVSKNIVYPLAVENENFSPSSLDFEDENMEEPVKGHGRCRPLKNFDPQEDCYSDVPGKPACALKTYDLIESIRSDFT